MEISESELRQVIDDMALWFDRGAFATSDALTLSNLIGAHLKGVEYVEEDDTLEEIPEEMMVRLLHVMFQGPTPEIREAARIVIHESTQHLTLIREEADHA